MPIRILLLLLLISAASDLRAQNDNAGYSKSTPQSGSQAVCPWLTQGSAVRALGGDVSVTVNVANTGEGSCRFLRQQAPMNSLEILVGKTSGAKCPDNSTRLTGIGNEAARCQLRESHGEIMEMVSSRVREFYFTVTLSIQGQKVAVNSSDSSGDALEQIAEQVAGNLY